MVHRYPLFYYLLIIILVSSSIVLSLVLFGNWTQINKILMSHQKERFRLMTKAASEEIEVRLSNVEGAIARNALLFEENRDYSRENAIQIFRQTLSAFPTIFAMEIIFLEDEKEVMNQSGFKAIYAWRRGEKSHSLDAEKQNACELSNVEIVDRKDLETDYSSEWFTKPIKDRGNVWSMPYKDPQIGVFMITYSVPVYKENKEILAIMTADVSLEWLDNLIDSFPIGNAGDPILITPEEIIFRTVEPADTVEAENSFVDKVKPCDKDDRHVKVGDALADNYRDAKKDKLKLERISNEDILASDMKETYQNLAECLVNSEQGEIRYVTSDTHENAWLYFAMLPRINWKLGCVISEKVIQQNVSNMNFRIFLAGIAGILALIAPAFLIARSVSLPLKKLTECAQEVAGGNFEADLPQISGNGEIPKLIGSFDSMRSDLQRYIRDLTESTKNEERLNSQLRVASNIQLGMVPKNFAPAAEANVDISAQMKPAQEVGGDLYDFAVLDEKHFYFCIGDVSGKGIPASLFMAVGKTLIHSAIQRDFNPAKALTWVNNQLMENNDAGLFITALCGIYHMDTREIEIACAGHNPPFIVDADGKSQMLNIDNSKFPLAIMEDVEYDNFRIPLPKGSAFFIYTDGVTDAANPFGEYFGEDNLTDRLSKLPKGSVRSLVDYMMSEIITFADGAKQSDDITILALRDMRV